MIPKECQPAVDALNYLTKCDSSEGIVISHRISALMALSKISDHSKFACEMLLQRLGQKYPGESARLPNVIWTGLPGNRVRTLSDAFLCAWSRAALSSQAWSMALILPGGDVCIPVDCLCYTHCGFGSRYDSEF